MLAVSGSARTRPFASKRRNAGYRAPELRLLRQLWSGHKVTWAPPEGVASIRKTPLTDAEVHPQPLQPKIRIWHGSATAERSVELAAEFGDPVFSANGMNPVTRYAELIRHYRDRWAAQGRDPAEALVGAGHGQTYVAEHVPGLRRCDVVAFRGLVAAGDLGPAALHRGDRQTRGPVQVRGIRS